MLRGKQIAYLAFIAIVPAGGAFILGYLLEGTVLPLRKAANYFAAAGEQGTVPLLRAKRIELVNDDDELRGILSVAKDENGKDRVVLAISSAGTENQVVLSSDSEMSIVKAQYGKRLAVMAATGDSLSTYQEDNNKVIWSAK